MTLIIDCFEKRLGVRKYRKRDSVTLYYLAAVFENRKDIYEHAIDRCVNDCNQIRKA
jgi:hypothetical protein